jgi:hypothetical protein
VILDYDGAIDFGNLDNNALTSDRGRIEGVEVISVDNGFANALTLHKTDVLDINCQVVDVGGIASLDNVLRIEGRHWGRRHADAGQDDGGLGSCCRSIAYGL